MNKINYILTNKRWIVLILVCFVSISCVVKLIKQDKNQAVFPRDYLQKGIAQNTLINKQDNTDGQRQVIQAFSQQLSKVPVCFQAKVYKLLTDDTVGLPHQKFLILLTNGMTILIAHDIKMAPRVPVHPGSDIIIKGEYVWNQKGGLVHWTHHSDTPYHAGGYIEYLGQRYQ